VEDLLLGLNTFFLGIPILNKIGAFGLALVVFTIGIRLALSPIFAWQIRAQRKMQAEQRLIAPHLAEIRKKYRNDQRTLVAEIQKVNKEHGISQFSQMAGCLPLLVQLPILIALFNGIRDATYHISDKSFLWVSDVSLSALQECCNLAPQFLSLFFDQNYLAHFIGGALLNVNALILPVVAACATYVQSKMMLIPPRANMSDVERQQYKLSQRMLMLGPILVFVIYVGLWYPLQQGLTIYWAMASLFMIAQQYHVVGWGSVKVPKWIPGAGRTTKWTSPVVGKAALESANKS
jgi:YidC/Oxa1 family membrane protein insertase